MKEIIEILRKTLGSYTNKIVIWGKLLDSDNRMDLVNYELDLYESSFNESKWEYITGCGLNITCMKSKKKYYIQFIYSLKTNTADMSIVNENKIHRHNIVKLNLDNLIMEIPVTLDNILSSNRLKIVESDENRNFNSGF